MFCRVCLLVLLVGSMSCASKKKATLEDILEQRMLGVDSVHGGDARGIIDKDTIITRNLKLDKKNQGRKTQEREPDWSYDKIPNDVASDVEAFKRNMTECLKEVQGMDRSTVKRLSPGKDSPVHGECLIACVLKRNGVIERGKVNKENLLALIGKFYSKESRMMKKLERNLDRCVESSAHAREECALAAHLNDCTNGLMASNKHKITLNY